MNVGYEVYREDTSIITSTERNGGMVFIETLSLTAGSSGSRPYPKVANGGLMIQANSPAAHTLSIGVDSDGNTRLYWTAGPYNYRTDNTYVAVMATHMVDTSPGSGLDIRNEAGEVLVTTEYPPPQCIGFRDFQAQAQSAQLVADGYTMYAHPVSSTIGAVNADRFLIMGLPNSGSADIWYVIDTGFIKKNQIGSVNLLVFSKSPTYTLPRIFIFAINNPNIVSSNVGVQVFDETQKLVYDACAENMALTDVKNINYVPYGGTSTYNVNARMATYLGMTMPGVWWQQMDGTFQIGGYGAVRKNGNQLTFRLMQTYRNKPSAEIPTEVGGTTQNLFCAIVDLTYLGFALGSGSGGNLPQITQQPNNTVIPVDNVAAFSISATGDAPLTYQWYSEQFGIIQGAVGSSYSFIAHSANDGNGYYCVVKNPLGSITSRTAYLTVTSGGGGGDPTDPPNPIGAFFTTHPETITVDSGNPATFIVDVSGTLPIRLQWRKNGSDVPGATGKTYSFTATMADAEADIYCVAMNDWGTATSAHATLYVNEASTFAPVISEQPVGLVANQGQVVFMRGSAYPCDRYAWYKDDVYYRDGQSIQLVTDTIGDSYYHFLAYNGARTTESSKGKLTVVGPTSSPYQSYNSIDIALDAIDNNVSFAIYKNGATSERDGWANGVGDGSLYTVSASGDFTPGSGSAAFNTSYDLANMDGVAWVAPKPPALRDSYYVTRHLYVVISLKGFGPVVSGTITITLRSTGTVIN